MAKFAHLVVDTSAFIKNVQLQEFAETCYTVQGVLDEIKNDRQLKRLVVLPYNLTVKEPEAEILAKVTAIAKKTGDFATLSLVDLKVVALTYQLEKQYVGTEHLAEDPKPAITIHSAIKPKEFQGSGNIQGFYNSKKRSTSQKQSESEANSAESDIKEGLSETIIGELRDKFAELNTAEAEALDQNIIANLVEENCEENKSEGAEQNDSSEENADENPSDEDTDDEGWITPSNIKEVKRDFGTDLLEDNPSPVACMTTDFAMQNVLKQVGLHIAALDGFVIKHARTYILRCYACFKTTSDATKVFCPKCGNKTLKKVAVSLDENGQQVIHINTRRPLTARYKNRPIAKFVGGKHSTNPLLFEDQPLPQQRISAKAKAKTNALDDDYIAGYSPFVMRDVDSRSAVLRGSSNLKQWMQNYEYDNQRRGYKK